MKRGRARQARATLRRRAALGLTAVAVASLGLVAGPIMPSMAADACFNFSVVGAADGVRVGIQGTGLLVNEADSEGPAAQASVNSLGQSLAFAGAPYPGEAAISAAALGKVDASQLPNYVATQYPSNREAEKRTPASHLSAKSEELAAMAAATGGGSNTPEQSTGATTSTAAAGCADDGDLTADATTDTQAVSYAAGTLRIGRIQSEAHAKIGPNGKPQLSAALDVGRMTVAGQTVTVDEEGMQYPGGSVPVGNPTDEVLASAGLRVTYIGEEVDPDGHGIRAPGLLVETTQDVGQGVPTTVSYTFGRSYARAIGDAAGEVPPPTETAVSGGPSEALVPDISSGDDATGLDLEVPAVESGATKLTDEPHAIAAPAETASTAQQPAATAASSVRPLGLPVVSIYLALAVGATAVFAGATLLRYFAVRLAWI